MRAAGAALLPAGAALAALGAPLEQMGASPIRRSASPASGRAVPAGNGGVAARRSAAPAPSSGPPAGGNAAPAADGGSVPPNGGGAFTEMTAPFTEKRPPARRKSGTGAGFGAEGVERGAWEEAVMTRRIKPPNPPRNQVAGHRSLCPLCRPPCTAKLSGMASRYPPAHPEPRRFRRNHCAFNCETVSSNSELGA